MCMVNCPRTGTFLLLWLTHAANRHVANYSAHRETCIRLRRPAQNKSTWQKARPINDPNRHPCTECLGAEATKVKRTTGCTVARTLVPKKAVKPAERQKKHRMRGRPVLSL